MKRGMGNRVLVVAIGCDITIVLLDFCNKLSWVNCTKLSSGGSKLIEEVSESGEERLRLVWLVPVGQDVLTEWLAEVQSLHYGIHVARVAELSVNAGILALRLP